MNLVRVITQQQQCVLLQLPSSQKKYRPTSGAFCGPKSSNEVRMWIGGKLLVLEEVIEEVLY